MREIRKILIANRGEIAMPDHLDVQGDGHQDRRRAFRGRPRSSARAICRRSDLHRPAPSAESYLNIPSIISAAEITNVDAIHPGYGFLAESATFAKICEDCNIKFIGPRADVIAMMGDKVEARRTMTAAGVPILPGSPDPIESPEEAKKLILEIGFPVIIKAAAGGGGRGMRIVRSEDELATNLELAQTEALNAFKNGAVYIERYIERPRHIEIQVLADEHGNVIHLGERECTIQRRHQKLLEEAPSPVITPEQRERWVPSP